MRYWFLIILLTLSFCAFGQETINTNVELKQKNFKVLMSNLEGKSVGLFILFFGTTPSKIKAMKNLMKDIENIEGNCVQLANVVSSRRVIFFLIGAVLIDEVRAELIEYTETKTE